MAGVEVVISGHPLEVRRKDKLDVISQAGLALIAELLDKKHFIQPNRPGRNNKTIKGSNLVVFHQSQHKHKQIINLISIKV